MRASKTFILLAGLAGLTIPIVNDITPVAAATGDVVKQIEDGDADPTANSRPVVSVDSAGNAVYAYLTDGVYVVKHCDDRACDDAIPAEPVFPLLDSSFFPNAIGLEVSAANNPMLVIGEAGNHRLLLLACNDPKCAGLDETVVVLDTLPTDIDVLTLDTTVDAAGNLAVSYVIGASGDAQSLKVIRCDDPLCAGDVAYGIDATPDIGQTSIAIDSGNRPVVMYGVDPDDPEEGDQIPAFTRLIRCDDTACTPDGNLQTNVGGTERSLFVDMTLTSADIPVFTYSDASTSIRRTNYVRCLDTGCAATAGHVQIGIQGGFSAAFLPSASIQLDSDGDPIIAQYGESVSGSDPTETLYVHRCGDITCLSTQSFDFDGRDGIPADASGFDSKFGLKPDLVLGANDAPIVGVSGYASSFGGDRSFWLVSCDDPGCDPNFTGPSSGPGASFVSSIAPARILETRPGEKTIDGKFAGEGPVTAGEVVRLEVAGRAGIPTDAAAAVINVTTIRPQSVGFITAFPCDQPQPLASSLNFATNLSIGNELVAGIDGSGLICLFASTAMNLSVDAVGYVPGASTYKPLVPARLLDTRANGETADGTFQRQGRTGVDGKITLDVTGRGGVPAGAAAVIVNVTAIGAAGGGFITVHPCLDPRPGTSALNFTAGVNRGNETIAALSTDGKLCLYSSQDTNLTVDVVGWLPANLDYSPVAPKRYVDTRVGQVTVDNRYEGEGKRKPFGNYEVEIAGRGDVPATARSVVLNLTSVSPESTGFVTVYDCEGARPLASSLNFVAGVNGGNEVISGLNDDGEVCFFTSAGTELVIDVVGYLG